jgi:hypothetical protein
VYARVATFEGIDPDRAAEEAENIRRVTESGEVPEALQKAKGVQILVDREHNQSLAIVLFDSEDDLRAGDEALNDMNPERGQGRRTSVQHYEVPLHLMR